MHRLIGIIVIGVLILLALLLSARTIKTNYTVPTPNSPIPAPESEKLAIIKDYTGRYWDLAHARDAYGMNPNYFNYGPGIGATPSIDNPTVVEEGDPRYPESYSNIPVFGVRHNGEQRAYSVEAMKSYRVFNDIFPGESNQYVAVAYSSPANLAVVYSREVEGNVITLAASEWTYGELASESTFVLMDKETESLWFPAGEQGFALPLEPVGETGYGLVGIDGIHADKVLKGEFLAVTTWAQWKCTYPDTKYVID
jgi:hypothetical protein